jgi:murein DD-endopeptidase MepM/ murein hydrolase activator NlpD
LKVPFLGIGDRARKSGPRDLTITITAGAGARPRQYRFSPAALRFVAVASALGVLAMVLVLVTYGMMAQNSMKASELRSENRILRVQLAKLGELEQRVQGLDQSRRSLLGVAGAASADSSYGPVMGIARDVTGVPVVYRRALPDTTAPGSDGEEALRAICEVPLRGPVTRHFGPIATGQFHTGVDVAGDTGEPVLAAGEGVVSFVGDDDTFGLVLVISHTARLSTMYGHNDRVLVRVGDFVSAGQTVAEVGSTGQSSAPHMHFEVHWDGRAIDPAHAFEELGGGF